MSFTTIKIQFQKPSHLRRRASPLSLASSTILAFFLLSIEHTCGFTLSPSNNFGLSSGSKPILSLHSTVVHSTDSDEIDCEGYKFPKVSAIHFEHRKKEWIDRSVKYYSTIRRMKNVDVVPQSESQGEIEHEAAAEELEEQNRKEFVELATRHYTALRKIKDGEFYHAERIYRRVIEKSVEDREIDGHCDHAKLAASTLLLALLKQRMGDIKGTRSVFVNFFRIVGQDDVVKCKCSAKVLGAFALFEMKCGHAHKSLFLAEKAVSMDEALAPVLKWKQFRDIERRTSKWKRGGGISAPSGQLSVDKKQELRP